MALHLLFTALLGLDHPSQAASTTPSWREALAADAAKAATADPELAALVSEIEPGFTRTGALRLVDPRLDTPLATPLLLERARSEADAELRAALIEAAARARGAWSAPVAGLLLEDPDPDVRALAAELLDDADPGPASALRQGAQDPSPAVREAVMRAIGGRTDGGDFADVLTRGLVDSDAGVRRYAARSAGWLDQRALYGGVAALLTDADPDVRLAALHAAARLDPGALASDPALPKLKADADPRIARAAMRAP